MATFREKNAALTKRVADLEFALRTTNKALETAVHMRKLVEDQAKPAASIAEVKALRVQLDKRNEALAQLEREFSLRSNWHRLQLATLRAEIKLLKARG